MPQLYALLCLLAATFAESASGAIASLAEGETVVFEECRARR